MNISYKISFTNLESILSKYLLKITDSIYL